MEGWPGNLNLRPLRTGDGVLVAPLYELVQSMHEQALPGQFSAPDQRRSAAFFDSWLQDATKFGFLVMANAEAVAYITAEVRELRRNFFRRSERLVEMHHCAVLPAYRRAGVAESLVNEVRREAERLGAGRIEVEIWSFNDPVRAFLMSCGYRALSERLTTNVLNERNDL